MSPRNDGVSRRGRVANLARLVNLASALTATGDDALSPEDKVALLQAERGRANGDGVELDRLLLAELSSRDKRVEEMRKAGHGLKETLEKLTEAPWHEGTYLGPVEAGEARKARVFCAGGRRVVSVGEDVDSDALSAGDVVYLGEGLNVILARAAAPRCGETASFDRFTADGRMVLKRRDEEFVVEAAPLLKSTRLRPGDQICWHEASGVALEKIERAKDSPYFLESTPTETFDDIGGLDAEIEEIKGLIGLALLHPEIAKKYKRKPLGSILLVGPPGTGKTLLARAIASWMATLGSPGCAKFMSIKPSELGSMWHSQTERNYREVFRVAREASEKNPDVPIVIFFDEIDSIGSRGRESNMQVDNRIVTALAAELDGLTSRGNILVVSATNVRNALDHALDRPGRLADRVFEVGRPGRKAAGEILSRHLPSDIPFEKNGYANSARAREELIESAVSQIYSENGRGDLATLYFRDGARRPVKPSGLVSGAILGKIANNAIDRACRREAKTGESGVRLDDVLSATSEAFETAAGSLHRSNWRQHLSDVPATADVMEVVLAERKVARPHRFLNLVT